MILRCADRISLTITAVNAGIGTVYSKNCAGKGARGPVRAAGLNWAVGVSRVDNCALGFVDRAGRIFRQAQAFDVKDRKVLIQLQNCSN
ncbi:MAG: hypothetical protein ACYSYV_11990 [Planctomycetota bacterium]|jgi:hypothetical protein